jgi:hypothetical protein
VHVPYLSTFARATASPAGVRLPPTGAASHLCDALMLIVWPFDEELPAVGDALAPNGVGLITRKNGPTGPLYRRSKLSI